MQFVHIQKRCDPLKLRLAVQYLRVLLDDIGKRISSGKVILIQAFLQIFQLHLIVLQRLYDLIQLHL